MFVDGQTFGGRIKLFLCFTAKPNSLNNMVTFSFAIHKLLSDGCVNIVTTDRLPKRMNVYVEYKLTGFRSKYQIIQ